MMMLLLFCRNISLFRPSNIGTKEEEGNICIRDYISSLASEPKAPFCHKANISNP